LSRLLRINFALNMTHGMFGVQEDEVEKHTTSNEDEKVGYFHRLEELEVYVS
jgi:hypothetical protein